MSHRPFGPEEDAPASGSAPAEGTDGPSAGDRRHSDRRQKDRRQRQEPVPVERRSGEDRRVGQRRAPRNINAYELGSEELEFIQAIGAHKERTGRAFPTWSEVLGILRSLGYEKRR
jgi:hypothetical protein